MLEHFNSTLFQFDCLNSYSPEIFNSNQSKRHNQVQLYNFRKLILRKG